MRIYVLFEGLREMHRAESQDNLLVKSYILLPLILSAFERDASAISSELRTPAPYLEVIQRAVHAASADLREIRAGMRARGLKVYEQQRLEAGVEARFVCRGYHERMLLLDDVIAAQATLHMRRYLGMEKTEQGGGSK